MKTMSMASVVLCTLLPSALLAQQPSAAAVLASFAANTAVGSYPAPEYPDGHWVARIMVRPEQFPVASVDSILDGLQNLALSSPSNRTRLSSIYWLSVAGSVDSASPREGVVTRLEDIYRNAESRQVRIQIANSLIRQVEVSAAVQVMELIASEDRPDEYDSEAPAAYAAVEGLLAMGPVGVAALRRLRTSDVVKNPLARSRLDRIAEDGFRN